MAWVWTLKLRFYCVSLRPKINAVSNPREHTTSEKPPYDMPSFRSSAISALGDFRAGLLSELANGNDEVACALVDYRAELVL